MKMTIIPLVNPDAMQVEPPSDFNPTELGPVNPDLTESNSDWASLTKHSFLIWKDFVNETGSIQDCSSLWFKIKFSLKKTQRLIFLFLANSIKIIYLKPYSSSLIDHKSIKAT